MFGAGDPTLWTHEQLSPETHEWTKGEFGPAPLTFFKQISKCVQARAPLSASRAAPSCPRTSSRRRRRPTRASRSSPAGANNCFLPESQQRTFDWFEQREPGRHSLHIVPGYGHLDVFVGKGADKDWLPLIVGELDKRHEPRRSTAATHRRATSHGEWTSITLFTTPALVGPARHAGLFGCLARAPEDAARRWTRCRSSPSRAGRSSRGIPYNGPPQQMRRLRSAHLFFEVHFNGSWAQYIDVVGARPDGGHEGVLGQLAHASRARCPAGPFQAFFRDHEVDRSHYYCAYPDATVHDDPAGARARASSAHVRPARRGLDAARSSTRVGGVPRRGAAAAVSIDERRRAARTRSWC